MEVCPACRNPSTSVPLPVASRYVPGLRSSTIAWAKEKADGYSPGRPGAGLSGGDSCHEAHRRSDRVAESASPAAPESNGRCPPFLRHWFGLLRPGPEKLPADCGGIALVEVKVCGRHQTSVPEQVGWTQTR